MAIHPDRPSDKLHDALCQIVREESEGGSMVTRWFCLAEVIGENGESAMWALTSKGLAMWDQIGMIEFHNRTLQPEVANDGDA